MSSGEESVSEALDRLRVVAQGRLAFEGPSRLPAGLPSSTELADWYAAGGPSGGLPWVAGELQIFGASELVHGQIGYRIHGLTGEAMVDWRDSWLVLAHQDGNPFVVDTAVSGSPVSVAEHGTGRWDLKPLADSLSAFGRFLGIWAELMSDFDTSPHDDDFELRPEFLSEVGDRSRGVLGPDGVDTLLVFLAT